MIQRLTLALLMLMAPPVGGTTIMVAWLALAGFAARKAL